MWRCAAASRRAVPTPVARAATAAVRRLDWSQAPHTVAHRRGACSGSAGLSSPLSRRQHLKTATAIAQWTPSPFPQLQQRRGLTTTLDSSVEAIYQKKTPLEHVLLRPGMYIGSVEATRDSMWMQSTDEAGRECMRQQTVEYVPALYKIFDEIIVNAVDNKTRDPSMRHLDIVIDSGSAATNFKPWISVHNDGRGIPVKFHKREQVYVPELVLGQLLTGSNFDDSSARLTGGRHGYGAKLTNIFSSEFVVETGDTAAGLRYRQVWKNNMRERGEPEITTLGAGHADFTRVSFSPDLARFEMDKLTPGMIRVLKKRVLDVAGCLSDVEVTLNGERVPISGFESYIQAFRDSTTTGPTPMIGSGPSSGKGATVVDELDDAVADDGFGSDATADYIYARANKRWQVGVLPSDVGFVQVSFVNGMSALRGGTHVGYVGDQLCRRIADHVNKKFPELNVSPAQVKPHMALFINCLIENPTFDSQMKEYMSSRPATYGSTCILSERFSKLVIANSGIVERVVDTARSKQRAALLKKVSSPRSRSSVNVPKLEDANLAGGPRSGECSLILTEGDSAKALAVAGIAVVGRDKYGVFPLRGKVLNVRDATVAQLAKNAEFAHLCTILGLKMDERYDTPEKRAQLRYGKVVIMTDQDHDGSHIKGLLFNLFHTFWPELLQAGTFMSEFITPIIKVSPSRGKDSKRTFSFFSLPEYFEWKNNLPADELKQYSIKYYKGLGTSTSAEGREYFGDLDKHLVDFHWSGDLDGDAIDMVFSKSRAADRKTWLLNEFNPESFLDTTSGAVTYRDFVNKELIQFSHADNARSLPSVVDGLKTSQRKVLFACLKRKLSKEVKVAQLAGYCSEHTAYHHGEASLHSTIVNMAQDFVGANNLPLLVPSGQFGTRLQGGKDAASPRYIFTLLQRHTRLLFPEEDDALLQYVDDDGFPVEPQNYVPIIPMLLVNGSEGIGTGWSTSVPSHHPVEVIDNLLVLLDAEEAGTPLSDVKLTAMKPWSKGFRGHIRQIGEQAFVSRGVVEQVNTTTLRISELPVGRWIEDYKKFLWDLVAKKTIRSFTEHHSERDVRFDVSMARSDLSKLVDDTDVDEFGDNATLIKLFKLESNVSTSNMHAFDASGKLARFESSEQVLRAFYGVRRELYGVRKAYLEKKQSKEVLRLHNRIRFIQEVAHGELQMVLKDRIPKAQLVDLLKQHAFTPASALKEDKPGQLEVATHDATELATDGDDGEFDYLLSTPLLSFTREVAERLQKEHNGKQERLEQLRATTPAQAWRQELQQLRASLVRDKDFRRIDE